MTVGPEAPLFTYSEWDSGPGDLVVREAPDGALYFIVSDNGGPVAVRLDSDTVHMLGNVLLTHYWRRNHPREP